MTSTPTIPGRRDKADPTTAFELPRYILNTYTSMTAVLVAMRMAPRPLAATACVGLAVHRDGQHLVRSQNSTYLEELEQHQADPDQMLTQPTA